MLKIKRNISLKKNNSLNIDSKAKSLIYIKNNSDIIKAINQFGTEILFVLGCGTNIVLCNENTGLNILKIEIPKIKLIKETNKNYIIEAGAGVFWHDLVIWSLANNYFGLENLALIPGTCGAAPVQNIGAYGLELKDVFYELEAINMKNKQIEIFDKEDCNFDYRESIFKQNKNYIITKIRLILNKDWQPNINYQDLKLKQEETNISSPNAKQIFEWVCEVRRKKLPDYKLIPNVGSFFKNPIISRIQSETIKLIDNKIVAYNLKDKNKVKIAASSLIESCNWKGKFLGNCGVYEKHSLIIIAKENVKGSEIINLANKIKESVFNKFEINLEIEPVLVN